MDSSNGTSALACRSCGASLDAARLDRRLSTITCSHCGTLHELTRGAAPATPVPDRPEVPMPARFDVRRRADGLRVSWPKGQRSAAVMLVLFALVWAGITGAGGLWFATPASLFFLYHAAVKAFNRTELRIDGASLAVVQGPLPWRGAMRLTRSDIDQLYVTEHVARMRRGGDDGGRVREVRSYRVAAVTREGRKASVLSGLGSPDQALWLEQEIERALGLADRPVGGEYRGARA